MNATQDEILNSSEAMIGDGGYHAFSFRQIADELDINSASPH
ncbi:MAG: AcrR family transcriptional regulator [Verrucomicrobiales bacterium]|jgi:AcrR family transcriptional regulator